MDAMDAQVLKFIKEIGEARSYEIEDFVRTKKLMCRSTLYVHLKDLHGDDQWIRKRIDKQEKHDIYFITPKGETALAKWQAENDFEEFSKDSPVYLIFDCIFKHGNKVEFADIRGFLILKFNEKQITAMLKEQRKKGKIILDKATGMYSLPDCSKTLYENTRNEAEKKTQEEKLQKQKETHENELIKQYGDNLRDPF